MTNPPLECWQMASKANKRSSKITASTFLLALVMGPGPGSLLVAPHGSEPRFLLGIPALYVWLVFWFLVMAGCVLFASTKLWRDQS